METSKGPVVIFTRLSPQRQRSELRFPVWSFCSLPNSGGHSPPCFKTKPCPFHLPVSSFPCLPDTDLWWKNNRPHLSPDFWLACCMWIRSASSCLQQAFDTAQPQPPDLWNASIHFHFSGDPRRDSGVSITPFYSTEDVFQDQRRLPSRWGRDKRLWIQSHG